MTQEIITISSQVIDDMDLDRVSTVITELYSVKALVDKTTLNRLLARKNSLIANEDYYDLSTVDSLEASSSALSISSGGASSANDDVLWEGNGTEVPVMNSPNHVLAITIPADSLNGGTIVVNIEDTVRNGILLIGNPSGYNQTVILQSNQESFLIGGTLVENTWKLDASYEYNIGRAYNVTGISINAVSGFIFSGTFMSPGSTILPDQRTSISAPLSMSFPEDINEDNILQDSERANLSVVQVEVGLPEDVIEGDTIDLTLTSNHVTSGITQSDINSGSKVVNLYTYSTGYSIPYPVSVHFVGSGLTSEALETNVTFETP